MQEDEDILRRWCIQVAGALQALHMAQWICPEHNLCNHLQENQVDSCRREYGLQLDTVHYDHICDYCMNWYTGAGCTSRSAGNLGEYNILKLHSYSEVAFLGSLDGMYMQLTHF